MLHCTPSRPVVGLLLLLAAPLAAAERDVLWEGAEEVEDEAPANHSPRFDANEATLVIGVRTMAGLAWDYLHGR